MASRYLICQKCSSLNRVPVERIQSGPRCGKCKHELEVAPVVAADPAVLDLAIRSSPVPVVVDFWAPWCGPCLHFAPVFLDYASKNPATALYLKLDTEEHPAVGQRFSIRGIPTLVLFSQGKELARQSGAMNFQQLSQWLLAVKKDH